MTDHIRVSIIGTAARSSYLYGPLLKGLSESVELVSVWGRSENSAPLAVHTSETTNAARENQRHRA